MKKGWTLLVLGVTIALQATACGKWELRDKSKDDVEDSYSYPVPIYPAVPISADGTAQDCHAWVSWVGVGTPGYGATTSTVYQCSSNNDYSWRSSCQSAECRPVKVFVHYMLDKGLGDSRIVQIEAFDNMYFQGAPRASVEITSFAAKQGEWKDADLLVEPGEYYLRAYIGSVEEVRVPYVMGGMEVVGEQPFGVYGAVSQPQKISVSPQEQNASVNPVHIMLDKLVAKPGTEAPTNARLRFALVVADMTKMQPGRKLIVMLLDEADPAAMPVHQFEQATDLFFIAGREGKADLITPALELGSYYVFAYVDLNSNTLLDEGEPQVMLKEGDEAKKIALKEKYTLTVPLGL